MQKKKIVLSVADLKECIEQGPSGSCGSTQPSSLGTTQLFHIQLEGFVGITDEEEGDSNVLKE